VTLLDVKDLSTSFRTEDGVVRAVEGVNFSVEKGQTLGIVGESGCGKSVTCLTIMGLNPKRNTVTGGEALWKGNDLLTMKPSELRAVRGDEISMIFQDPMTSLNPVHTIGRQLIEAVLLHRDVTKRIARSRALELLKAVGIPRAETRIDDYPHQFSGGMRQRVMIAMALINNPDLLIADEPTTALDVTTQAQILDLLRHLQTREGMAIMLITHNLGVVAEMCDEVVVMYLGRVVERGPVDAIFHAPQHPYTQALLRSIPSIQAQVRTKLPTIAGSIPHPHNRPPGCPFHPRCVEWIRGTCERHEPELLPLDGENRVAVSCFLHHPPRVSGAIPAGAQAGA
jgi:peptide/nickel transport system ATP-binding protein